MSNYFLMIPLFLILTCGCQLTSELPNKSSLEAIALREDQRVGVDEIFPYFDNASAEVRLRAAQALMRLRSAEAVDFIVAHLDKERDSRVTEMLLFALGQIGDPRAADCLLKFFASSVDPVRAAAVEGAGKIKDPALTLQIVDRLLDDASAAVRSEACLALFRLGARRYALQPELPADVAIDRSHALVRALGEDLSQEVRWRAAYALMEIQDPAAAAPLRQALLDDENIWVRCFAARAFRALPKSKESQKALIQACAAARRAGEWSVVVEALSSLGDYTDLETAALLINYLLPGSNSNFHIRATAASALGRFNEAGETIVKALVRATNDPSRTVVGAAIVALGSLGDTVDFLETTSESRDRYIRLKTVEAAHKLGLDGLDILLELGENESIRVRCAALEALADPIYADFSEDMVPLAEEAVMLDDMALRYTGAQLLQVLGVRESVPLLKSAYLRSQDPEMAEARLKIVEAMAALGGPDDVEFFREAAQDPDFMVRNVGSQALSTISGELIQVEPKTITTTIRPVAGEDYKDGKLDPVAHFVTNKGDFWVVLFKNEAPTHVKNFIDLSRAGVYRKLTFHRVVSNFVVQGLDPRGDGWGFNGIHLRDEINRVKFLRGYMGMPHSGPDTGGCQIFITHCPTPHLDGNYTVFGRVIQGMEVVDTLEVGDVILGINIK